MGDNFWYKAQNSYDHRTGYGRSMPCKGHELDRENTDRNYLIYVEKTNNNNNNYYNNNNSNNINININNNNNNNNNNENEEMIAAVNAIYAIA